MRLGRLLAAAMRVSLQARRQPRPARYLLAHFLWGTGLGARLGLQIRLDGVRLRFHRAAGSAFLWLDQRNGAADRRFLREYLRPGDTVVDVGASIGSLTLTAAAVVGPHGHVIAIEPHPRVFEYLRENVELNRAEGVTCHRVAAGAEAGSVLLTDMLGDDRNRITPRGEIAVEQRPLDELLADVGPISLLKIDTEGYELLVLRGATRTLARTACVYFEAIEQNARSYGYTVADVCALLAEAGFDVRDPADLIGDLPELRDGASMNLVAFRDPSELKRRLGAT